MYIQLSKYTHNRYCYGTNSLMCSPNIFGRGRSSTRHTALDSEGQKKSSTGTRVLLTNRSSYPWVFRAHTYVRYLESISEARTHLVHTKFKTSVSTYVQGTRFARYTRGTAGLAKKIYVRRPAHWRPQSVNIIPAA